MFWLDTKSTDMLTLSAGWDRAFTHAREPAWANEYGARIPVRLARNRRRL
jgi:hypothetical protein